MHSTPVLASVSMVDEISGETFLLDGEAIRGLWEVRVVCVGAINEEA